MAFYYHTLPACNRCRKRKSRCDIGRPLCGPCKAANTPCEFVHASTGRIISRSYIHQLETQLSAVEADNNYGPCNQDEPFPRYTNEQSLQEIVESPGGAANRDGGEASKAHADLILLGEDGSDAHFLGLSSGIHLARAVLESAAQEKDTVHENGAGVSSFAEEENRDNVQQNQSLDQAHPLNSTSAKPHDSQLPSHQVAAPLIDIFFSRCQFPYAILEQDEFIKEVAELYKHSSLGSSSILLQSPSELDRVKTRFMLYMVLAIALLSGVGGKQPEEVVIGRAESYYSSAVVKLTDIIQFKDERSLQCLLLFLFYSLQHSTSAPIWYISGLSVRMCIDLGLHTEREISSTCGAISQEEEKMMIDRKRRLFWTTYSLDQTFSLILGRPFAFKHGSTDVKYPSMTLHESQRMQFIHWLQLQELQNKIISHLYLSKGDEYGKWEAAPSHTNDLQNDFIESMEMQLNQWKDSESEISRLESFSSDWWTFWYFNTILLLKRPSPRNPNSTDAHILTCYSAAISIIQIAFVQLDHDIRSITFTWSDVHHLIMAGITFLFTLWNYPEARVQARKDILAVRGYLGQLKVVIDKMSSRWPQIARTQQVLKVLTQATIEFLEIEEGSEPRHGSSFRRQGLDHAQQHDNSTQIPEYLMQQRGSSNCYSSTSLHNREHPQSETPPSDPHMFRGSVRLSPHNPFSADPPIIPHPHPQIIHSLSQERTTCTLPAAAECIPAPGIWPNNNTDQTSSSNGYTHAALSCIYEGVNNNNIADQESLWNKPLSTPFPGSSAWIDFPWDDSSNNDLLPFDMHGLGLASRFSYFDLFGDFIDNEQVFPCNAAADNLIQGQGSYNSALNFQRSPDP